MHNLRTLRKNDNVEDLRGVLEACVKANFGKSLLSCTRSDPSGGIESPQLYSQTYFGTKRLVEEYVDEGLFLLLLFTEIQLRDA